MTTAKQLALTLALSLCALLATAQAQTARVSTVNVTSEGERVHIAAQGDVSEMRIEVSDEQGDVVFQSGAITGQQLDWNMKDSHGERVAAGTYLVTVTYRNAAGKVKKRVEQVTVEESEKADTKVVPTTAPTAVQATITGTGTANKIAKFTGAATIGNSIITESATKRIGINNTAPTATLQVNAAQPPPLAGNGTSAATLLQTSGGKGGNTNGAAAGFQNAGAGASISLLAGNGGDAPAGSRRGNGGSITLQPGSTGTGAGLAGVSGNVLIGPSGVGNVGIGTLSPTSKLTVRTATDNYGLVHTDGTVTVGSFVNVGGGWYGTQSNHRLNFFTNDSGATMTIATSGRVGIGTTNPINGKLHVDGGSSRGVYGQSNSGDGVFGKSTSNTGVYGQSTSSTGVLGTSDSGDGVYGQTSSGRGVYGQSGSGDGVHGLSNTGYAGLFSGKAKVTGNLQVGSCTGCARIQSDRNLKTNFSTINPRLVLDRLSAIPIKSWNYKSDEQTVRHIGPMAQDFRAAFNLGVDDKHIDMIDANGVTMAAIQGLYQMVQEKDKKNEQLVSEVQQLRAQLLQQQVQLNQVKRTIKRKRTVRKH